MTGSGRVALVTGASRGIGRGIDLVEVENELTLLRAVGTRRAGRDWVFGGGGQGLGHVRVIDWCSDRVRTLDS